MERPAPPSKRIIKEDFCREDFDKARVIVAWVIFGILAVPMACLFVIACVFGIVALVLLFIPVVIAPKQEMRFGYKKMVLGKGPWLSKKN